MSGGSGSRRAAIDFNRLSELALTDPGADSDSNALDAGLNIQDTEAQSAGGKVAGVYELAHLILALRSPRDLLLSHGTAARDFPVLLPRWIKSLSLLDPDIDTNTSSAGASHPGAELLVHFGGFIETYLAGSWAALPIAVPPVREMVYGAVDSEHKPARYWRRKRRIAPSRLYSESGLTRGHVVEAAWREWTPASAVAWRVGFVLPLR
ncbi:hypothetical protein LTR53_002529 [Teratosphaeriaceae sp. CCFEE 6253]|nr:hypothetical protein LTR53_002529 [Teratosphaeriaceae sp. CCFEE 6253]